MTDDKTLVARLLNVYAASSAEDLILQEAADRIEALEKALRWIKNMPLPPPSLDDPAHNMRTIATRALGDGQ